MRYRLGFAASWRAAMPTAPGSEVSPGVSNRMVSVMDPQTLTPDPAPGNGFSLEAIIVVSGFMGKHIAWYACLPKLFSPYGERQTYRRAPDRLTRLSGVDMPDPRFPQPGFTITRSSAQSAQHPCEIHPSRLRPWSISCGAHQAVNERHKTATGPEHTGGLPACQCGLRGKAGESCREARSHRDL